jgi:hypothetical protein
VTRNQDEFHRIRDEQEQIRRIFEENERESEEITKETEQLKNTQTDKVTEIVVPDAAYELWLEQQKLERRQEFAFEEDFAIWHEEKLHGNCTR